MLNPRLKALRPEVLRELADYHHEASEDCATFERIKARRHERAAFNARKAAILEIPDLVRARALAAPVERAIDQAALETGLPIETVAAAWRQSEKTRQRIARAHRDIAILRMARHGWTNGEIAAEVELHPGTVARIIQRMLRDGSPEPGPARR